MPRQPSAFERPYPARSCVRNRPGSESHRFKAAAPSGSSWTSTRRFRVRPFADIGGGHRECPVSRPEPLLVWRQVKRRWCHLLFALVLGNLQPRRCNTIRPWFPRLSIVRISNARKAAGLILRSNCGLPEKSAPCLRAINPRNSFLRRAHWPPRDGPAVRS